jgi:hypothetical protein
MKGRRKKELATIVAPKAILQSIMSQDKQIRRTNSKVFHN